MSAEQLLIRDAEFRVSEAGRRRVVKTRRKTVHAGVVGTLEAVWGAQPRDNLSNGTIKGLAIGKPWRPFDGVAVRYNPYETKTFVKTRSARPVESAERVLLDHCEAFAEGAK